MNDPAGLLFPRLRAVNADLKTLFETVHLSVPLDTQRRFPQEMAWLTTESFYQVLYYDRELAVGDDFLTLYAAAARSSAPDQVVHLCYIDRVAFALQTAYRDRFIHDVTSLPRGDAPLIFQRSPAAWETHPRNYYDFESMVTLTGQRLFGRSLDFCWCHLAIPAGRLREILPLVTRRDMAHVAEYVLAIRDEVRTAAVDWLAWEDPFIFGRNPAELKLEREQSLRETHKRLAYVIPMLELLNQASDGWTSATW